MAELKIHPHFDHPEPTTSLWRYMDLTKLLAILEYESLYMVRIDKFTDTFEGVIPAYDKANRDTLYKEDGLVEIMDHVDGLAHLQRSRSYVNCWHMNEFESAAMWSLYLKSDEGIAIKTSFQALSDSIIDNEHKTWIGSVDYIDYDNTAMPRGNHYYPSFFKRKSFEHEKEVRIFYGENPNEWFSRGVVTREPLYSNGFNLKVDIKSMIGAIYVSPTSPPWLFELVKRIIEKYSLATPVIQSTLYSSPLV
jgi:hypothetical protein